MEKKYTRVDLNKLHESVPWLTENGFDYSKYPIEHVARDIQSKDDQKFRNAIRLLCSMAQTGRMDAIIFLFGAFEYFKDDIRVLERLAENMHEPSNDLIINFIFQQIEKTPSSNKTRVYIKGLIKFLSYCKGNVIKAGFEKLLANPNFTYRMKEHFREALYGKHYR